MKKGLLTKITCLLILSVILLTGCGKERTPIGLEGFNEVMEEEGFEIQDASNQYDNEEIEAVSIAMGENYQIEFYKASSAEAGKKLFAQGKAQLEDSKGGSNTEKSVSIKNYSLYSLTSGDQYSYVSRTDDNFVYMVVDKEYKKEVQTLMEKIGM